MQKKIWLALAVVAIGIVVLPQTIAMFAGQHDWYDTTLPGNQVLCAKCHADIFQELSQGGTSSVNGLHRTQIGDNTGCDSCHVTTAPALENLTQGPGGQFHAAASPACLDCHSGTGGGGKSALEIVNGTEEVHKAFINQSVIAKFLKGSNEACISCHTHIGVNITWTKATTIQFAATEVVLPDGSHSWTVGSFNATGVNVTQT
jgi:nitrate/TMAO reductase-like tetraheme cytochrome c subunit